MKRPNVLTVGGANRLTSSTATATAAIEEVILPPSSSALVSSSISISDGEQSTNSKHSKSSHGSNKTSSTASTKQRENRPPNKNDDDNSDALLSYDDDDDDDDDEDMERQMLLSPSVSANSDVVDDEDQQLVQQLDDLYDNRNNDCKNHDSTITNKDNTNSSNIMNNKTTILWLCICFFGIMLSFVGYGLLLEYATSGGRKLHELSFLFVTSLLYTVTAAAGRHVRDETPTTIPPARFAVLGITSMGSTFCSVRSLRYVIFPIQVLAKSCKPVPVMLMGALMGKKYPLRKYINVFLIVLGVGLFMGGGSTGGGSHGKKHTTNNINDNEEDNSSSMQIFGLILLFISLCFDGGTGAYEDKLMAVHHVGPFDLMYNIQLGKTIIAGVGLLVLNQVHVFLQMCQEMGFVLVALGLTGALGQVFIFITIAKFGALTCSIIGLARKVTTLLASIYAFGHVLNAIQISGLVLSVASMVMNFMGKKGKKKGGHGDEGGHSHEGHGKESLPTVQYRDNAGGGGTGSIELPTKRVQTLTVGGGR